MLKEIKVRYETKCMKCQRDIKVGWTAFYEADGKKLYCVPCGNILKLTEAGQLTETKPASAIEIMLDGIYSSTQANTELLGAVGLRLEVMQGCLTKLLEVITPKLLPKSKK